LVKFFLFVRQIGIQTARPSIFSILLTLGYSFQVMQDQENAFLTAISALQRLGRSRAHVEAIVWLKQGSQTNSHLITLSSTERVYGFDPHSIQLNLRVPGGNIQEEARALLVLVRSELLYCITGSL